MNQWRYLVVMMLSIMVFSGCSSKPKKPTPPPPIQRVPPPAFGETTTSSSIPTGQSTTETSTSSMGDPNQRGSVGIIPSERIVYFDYDQSEIKSSARILLEKHATYLSGNPNTSVRLEGHADERGSREYNLALGERRAEAVKNQLINLGVFENQLTTLSYGEEQPVALEHSERAWRLNRRVEIVYP